MTLNEFIKALQQYKKMYKLDGTQIVKVWSDNFTEPQGILNIEHTSDSVFINCLEDYNSSR